MRAASFPAAGFGEMTQKPLCSTDRQTDRWVGGGVGGGLAVKNKYCSEKSVKSKERSWRCFANEFTANQELQVTADR